MNLLRQRFINLLQAIQDLFFVWRLASKPTQTCTRISEYRPLKQQGVTDDALLEAMYLEQ